MKGGHRTPCPRETGGEQSATAGKAARYVSAANTAGNTLTETERTTLTRRVREAATVRPQSAAFTPADRAMSVSKLIDGRTAVDSLPALHRHLTDVISTGDDYMRARSEVRIASRKGIRPPEASEAVARMDTAKAALVDAQEKFVRSAPTGDATSYYMAVTQAISPLTDG